MLDFKKIDKWVEQQVPLEHSFRKLMIPECSIMGLGISNVTKRKNFYLIRNGGEGKNSYVNLGFYPEINSKEAYSRIGIAEEYLRKGQLPNWNEKEKKSIEKPKKREKTSNTNNEGNLVLKTYQDVDNWVKEQQPGSSNYRKSIPGYPFVLLGVTTTGKKAFYFREKGSEQTKVGDYPDINFEEALNIISKTSAKTKAKILQKQVDKNNAKENYELFVQKIYDRSFELGEIFKNHISFSFLNENELGLIVNATGDDMVFFKKSWRVIHEILHTIFDEKIKIVNAKTRIPAVKSELQTKPQDVYSYLDEEIAKIEARQQEEQKDFAKELMSFSQSQSSDELKEQRENSVVEEAKLRALRDDTVIEYEDFIDAKEKYTKRKAERTTTIRKGVAFLLYIAAAVFLVPFVFGSCLHLFGQLFSDGSAFLMTATFVLILIVLMIGSYKFVDNYIEEEHEKLLSKAYSAFFLKDEEDYNGVLNIMVDKAIDDLIIYDYKAPLEELISRHSTYIPAEVYELRNKSGLSTRDFVNLLTKETAEKLVSGYLSDQRAIASKKAVELLNKIKDDENGINGERIQIKTNLDSLVNEIINKGNLEGKE